MSTLRPSWPSPVGGGSGPVGGGGGFAWQRGSGDGSGAVSVSGHSRCLLRPSAARTCCTGSAPMHWHSLRQAVAWPAAVLPGVATHRRPKAARLRPSLPAGPVLGLEALGRLPLRYYNVEEREPGEAPPGVTHWVVADVRSKVRLGRGGPGGQGALWAGASAAGAAGKARCTMLHTGFYLEPSDASLPFPPFPPKSQPCAARPPAVQAGCAVAAAALEHHSAATRIGVLVNAADPRVLSPAEAAVLAAAAGLVDAGEPAAGLLAAAGCGGCASRSGCALAAPTEPWGS